MNDIKTFAKRWKTAKRQRPGGRTRTPRGAVALMAMLLSAAVTACGSSTPQVVAAISVHSATISAPVQTVKTRLGTVEYRVVGSGPPLVMILGYTATLEIWDPRFVDALAKHYRVVLFNNAGIGRTQALHGPLTIDAMANQTSALITALHLNRPNVLGWSMGGLIAQALAVQHPAQVRHLVLCATYPGTGPLVQPSQKALQAPSSLFPTDQGLAYEAYGLETSLYRSRTSAPANVSTAQSDAIQVWWNGQDPAGRKTAAISAPTLIADGTVDGNVPIADDYALARLMPKAQLVLYPDAGHFFLFQEGTTFTSRIQSFLSGAPGPMSTAQMRTRLAADETRLGIANATWERTLKALPAKSHFKQAVQMDQALYNSFAAFDAEILRFGATGTIGAAVSRLADADVTRGNAVIAFADQSKSYVTAWKATKAHDDEMVQQASMALHQALGIR